MKKNADITSYLNNLFSGGSSKGISPLIAAVLLIAFTMAVASLFAQWAPNLIQEAQGDTQNKTGEIQRCSEVVVEVIEGDINATTFQQTAGEAAAGDVSVTWFYQDDDPIQNTTTIDNNRGSARVSHDLKRSAGNTLDEIRITPTNCEGAASTRFTG